MSTLQSILDGTKLVLRGPAGSAELGVASLREPEEGNRDRASLELTMTADVEGSPQPRILLWVYVHDSYDGEHRLVLEEGIVCTALLDSLNRGTGTSFDASGFIRAAIDALPAWSGELECLASQLDQAEVTDQLYGPNLS